MATRRRGHHRHRSRAVSDVEYDLAEILRSPLEPDPDDEREARGWLAAVLAFVAAAAVTTAAVTGWTGGEDQVSQPTSSVAAEEPATRDVVVAEPTPFPDDYVPIAGDVAVRTESPLIHEDRLLVPLTMVVRRGADPSEIARPLGGQWELRTATGVITSLRTVYDPFLPSVWSVEFPPLDDLPGELVMVERWDPTEVEGSVELEWTGLEYQADEPITIELGAGASLQIVELRLANFLGRAQWQLEGADLGVVELDVDLFTESGELLGDYTAVSASIDPEPRAGFIDYAWLPGIQVDQDDAVTLRLTARATVGSRAPVDIAVPIGG